MAGPLAAAGRVYDRLFAAVYDLILAGPERAGLGDARTGLLAHASGRVVEIGAGTGVNLRHLPRGLRSLVLVEPSGTDARTARAGGRRRPSRAAC